MSNSIPEPILEQAIGWSVKLKSGTASKADHLACQQWRAANPIHEKAWQQVQGLEQLFDTVPKQASHLARHTLDHSAQQAIERRHLLKMLGIVTVATVGATLLWQFPLRWQQTHVYQTAVGERRDITLADGSHLLLNTASTVTLQVTPLRQSLVLQQGELLVATAKANRWWQPLTVITPHAQLHPLGTRFTVYHMGDMTRLHVAEGAVTITAATNLTAAQGETFTIHTTNGIPTRLDQPALDPLAWSSNALSVRQMRLADFIDELARYSQMPLQCHTSAAHLQVSGVFQLHGDAAVDTVLNALARTLPIRIVRRERVIVVRRR